jgi:hypothetical protein
VHVKTNLRVPIRIPTNRCGAPGFALSPVFEPVLVLVRLYHVASVIVNANQTLSLPSGEQKRQNSPLKHGFHLSFYRQGLCAIFVKESRIVCFLIRQSKTILARSCEAESVSLRVRRTRSCQKGADTLPLSRVWRTSSDWLRRCRSILGRANSTRYVSCPCRCCAWDHGGSMDLRPCRPPGC